MATASVIKLKVRRGSDASRQLVILDQGEIGYTTDSKRLFVGDGSSTGGISTGSKFYATYTGIANATATSSDLLYTAQTGDIVYDATTNPTGFYILSGNNSSFNKLSAYTAFNVNQTIYTSVPFITGNAYVVSSTTYALILTAATTLTLPTPSVYPGRWLTIKNAIAPAVIVSATSNVISITGATGISAPNTTILPQSGSAVVGKWVQLQSDGTNWVAMAAN